MLKRVWKKGTLLHCWWECGLEQSLWKTVKWFQRKLKIDLLCDPAIPLLHIQKKTILKRHMHLSVHSSTAHNSQNMETTNLNFHQQRNGYRRNGTYIMEYYSAIKRNVLSHFSHVRLSTTP